MTIEQSSEVIRVGFAAASIWVLYMAYRAYRSDALRDDLFARRDQLFGLALSGQISFSEGAFVGRWKLLNALIHFADRMSFGRAVLPSVMCPISEHDLARHQQWRKHLRPEHAVANEPLEQLDSAIHWILARHLIRRTVVFLPVLLALSIISLLREVLSSVSFAWRDTKADLDAIEKRERDTHRSGADLLRPSQLPEVLTSRPQWSNKMVPALEFKAMKADEQQRRHARTEGKAA